MARLTLARSLRLALLGLTVVLAAVAAGGVAFLYETRQTYEDRLAEAYELRTAASRLLAAGVVEEATLRTARGSAADRQRRSARRAFELTLADARELASHDSRSAAALAEAARQQSALRANPRSDDAPLAARESLAVLARRQTERLEAARDEAADDSRTAVLAAGAGGLLALIAALILVSAMVGAVRRPLDRLVEAARRLAAGDLSARVEEEDGPGELRALAGAFNAMAADLEGASARVEAERRRLDTTIRSLGDGLLITDAAGIVEHTNPRAGALIPELEPGSPVGDRLGDLEQALAGEETLERDGRTLLVTAARLGEDGDVVWTVRDATERVRLERLKSEFVATASHELRSPLTSIKGFVELLAAGGQLSDRQREFVEIIELSTNRLVDLVNDLLDVARVEAGRVEIHRRPTDMTEAVREVAMLLRPRIDEKAQTLQLDLPDDLPLALADPSRVRQILTNLLTNAHLYTDTDGTLTVSLRASAQHVVLEVADDGRGMTEEEIDHAFDRFYRGRGEGSHPHPPGTGLGLAIVRSLVELHGGTVTITSSPGEGTRFTVRMPRAADTAEGLPAPRHALRGRRVLVVDDEPAIAGLIAERLAPYEVEVVVVNSGEEALECLRTGRFDAITLDILMPGISGFEVLRILRADPKLRGIPVVVV